MNRRLFRYAGWLAIAAFALGILLAGCGQKGNLYHPEEDQTVLNIFRIR
ncbi:MAG: lipoprotein [Gammaproteobacteria bacterium]|nr:lipoprotein [Gammaproteobacteria bacterium]MCI0591712.1 lipoprotein [Gammaproteobacteria bacterium]